MKEKVVFVPIILKNRLSQAQVSLKLLYEQSSGNTWGNTMLIGKGGSTGMRYGNVEKEILQLNKHTLWSSNPNPIGSLLDNIVLAVNRYPQQL